MKGKAVIVSLENNMTCPFLVTWTRILTRTRITMYYDSWDLESGFVTEGKMS